MGYNVTPRRDGGFHVENDGKGCGCLLTLILIGLGFLLFVVGGNNVIDTTSNGKIIGIILIVIGFFVYFKKVRD